MAPPRKPAEPGRGHPVYLRLPTDVFERIEAKAKAEARPFNRITINELAAFPRLEREAKLGELIRDMETVLARYGSRIAQAELGEALLQAADEILAARSQAELQPLLDRMRVVRRTMLEMERQVARGERERLVDHIKRVERQIEAIEALPESAHAKDDLPGLRDELSRLQRSAALA
jgi:hypothetical protein